MGFFFYLCSSSRRRFSCAFLHLRWTFLWHDTWGNGIAQRKEHKFVILENQILFILWYNITISLMYSIVSLKCSVLIFWNWLFWKLEYKLLIQEHITSNVHWKQFLLQYKIIVLTQWRYNMQGLVGIPLFCHLKDPK